MLPSGTSGKTKKLLAFTFFAGGIVLHVIILMVFLPEPVENVPVLPTTLVLDLSSFHSPSPEALSPILKEKVPAAPIEEREEETVKADPIEPVSVPAVEVLEDPQESPPEENENRNKSRESPVASAVPEEGVSTAEDAAAASAGDIRTDYKSLIMQHLEKRKIYPSAARKRELEGDVTVRFTVLPDGTVEDIDLVDSSAHKFLSDAAVKSVRRAAPFPLPADSPGQIEMVVTIQYKLTKNQSRE